MLLIFVTTTTIVSLISLSVAIGYAYGIKAGKSEPLAKLRKQIEEENAESTAEKYLRKRAYEER